MLAYINMFRTEVGKYLAGTRQLTRGFLPIEIVRPGDLNKLLEETNVLLNTLQGDFRLFSSTPQSYYDKPDVVFTYANGTILLQITAPIIKLNSRPLKLYKLETVYVPLDAGRTGPERTGPKGQKQFTRIENSHPYFAVDGQDYVAISQAQFDTCRSRDGVFLCNTNLLYVDNNRPSCLSDIYYNKPLADIVEHCEFIFFTHLNPIPALIDTGRKILLANVRRPWILHCAQRRVPIRHEGSDYAIVDKTELCGCSLTADNTYIPAHSTGCGAKIDSIKP